MLGLINDYNVVFFWYFRCWFVKFICSYWEIDNSYFFFFRVIDLNKEELFSCVLIFYDCNNCYRF